MTARASGFCNSAPAPRPKAKGSNPNNVQNVVINRSVTRLAVLDDPHALGGKAQSWMPQAAEALFERSMTLGWDTAKGGFFYTLDWQDNPDKRSKLWWPMCEAAGAAHFLNHHVPNSFHEESYRKIWSTIAAHFIDRDNGGWFEETTEDLKPANTLFPGKGDIYHAFQACLIPLFPATGAQFRSTPPGE